MMPPCSPIGDSASYPFGSPCMFMLTLLPSRVRVVRSNRERSPYGIMSLPGTSGLWALRGCDPAAKPTSAAPPPAKNRLLSERFEAIVHLTHDRFGSLQYVLGARLPPSLICLLDGRRRANAGSLWLGRTWCSITTVSSQ